MFDVGGEEEGEEVEGDGARPHWGGFCEVGTDQVGGIVQDFGPGEREGIIRLIYSVVS